MAALRIKDSGGRSVEFREFVADHVGTVKRIYEHFSMELRPEVERRQLKLYPVSAAEGGARHTAVGPRLGEWTRMVR